MPKAKQQIEKQIIGGRKIVYVKKSAGKRTATAV
jgi:hypothetical protein